METQDRTQTQFIHLLRLAWDLRRLGLDVTIGLPRSDDPSLIIRRTEGPFRVTAGVRDRKWAFVWGRRRSHWVPALDERAPDRIHDAAFPASGMIR